MTVGVFFGIKGMRNGRRREEEQRRLAAIDALVEGQANTAAHQQVDLEKSVMPMHRRIAAEKLRERAKGLVVDVAFRVAPVVGPTDMNVRYRQNGYRRHLFPQSPCEAVASTARGPRVSRGSNDTDKKNGERVPARRRRNADIFCNSLTS